MRSDVRAGRASAGPISIRRRERDESRSDATGQAAGHANAAGGKRFLPRVPHRAIITRPKPILRFSLRVNDPDIITEELVELSGIDNQLPVHYIFQRLRIE